ncbi:MAG: isoaspartyl peptidase/L-asparaginase family protein [Sphingomonadales bacterium]
MDVAAGTPEHDHAHNIAIVIHGGAGTIRKGDMTPEKEAAYRQALEDALQAGYRTLEQGGSSLDAVVTAIRLMEDSPLFNAGKGAVFTNDGKNELDASIMDGRSLNAGSVAGVSHIKNPIALARLVMEKSEHVMLTGEGAEAFAKTQGVERVDPSYFYTERRWRDLQHRIKDSKHGTVGVVALDQNGNLAAGTSTGGMTNKKFGRVGDSPIIGAGTYANNDSCAVSGTGHGEYFIRANIAHDICALVEYKGLSVTEAADTVIHRKLTRMGGTGGVIVLDRKGNHAMVFNTEGMYRGYLRQGGEPEIRIYKE